MNPPPARRGEHLRRRVAQWMVRRLHRRLPLTLDRRTVYILPTGYGLFFAVIVLICVAGGLNYNNNLALLFAFLFAALGTQSMLLTYRNLSGLRLLAVDAASVHAGQPLQLSYAFESAIDMPRTAISVRTPHALGRFELARQPRYRLPLQHATTQRGWLQPEFLTVSSVWPFGLFEAWSYLAPEQPVLVWPALDPDAPPLPWDNSDAQGRTREGGAEDLRGLRPYVSGDPPRRIAWKRSAAREELVVRQFEQPLTPQRVLDWRQLAALGWEARISRLATWVDRAWRCGEAWVLRLPGQQLGPDQGDAHRRRCLDALAQLPRDVP